MLIDHVGAYFPRTAKSVILHVAAWNVSLYTVLRFIGRISFPIFAFLLVEGFLHTRDRRNYGLRLFLFALISELPWNLVHTGTWLYEKQNVFFTLFFGYLALCVIRCLEEDGSDNNEILILALVGLLAITMVFKADYGCGGFGFILMLYFLREQALFRAVVGSCILPNRWKEGLAFLFIGLYNGERGFLKTKAASLIFYVIYPLQLCIFYLIRKNTTGF